MSWVRIIIIEFIDAVSEKNINLNSMKIVVLDGYTTNPGDLDWSAFKDLGTCVIHDRTAPHQTLPRSEHADILLTNKTVIDRDCIRRLPRLF